MAAGTYNVPVCITGPDTDSNPANNCTSQAITVNPILTTVTNVTSSTANGAYRDGASVSIQVSLSGTVTVTGAPQLALNSGGTANYSSGSGTTTLTFTYTVAAGQNSAHLDYTAASALTLNGGTIFDANSLAAVLTLPSPGVTGSLGANKSIVIDTTAPTVTNVTSSTANGTYTTGQSISIQVIFSEIVNATGTPKLALNSGGTADYSAGSGSSTLTFTYTIAAGETSTHLDYASTTALTLSGGTITDGALNPAVLTLAAPGAAGSLGADKSFVVNPVPTTVTNVTSSTANGAYRAGQSVSIQVTFGGNVTVTGTPQLALNSGGTANYSSGSGSSILTFIYTVGAGQNSAHLDYASTGASTLNGGTILDASSQAAVLTLASPGTAGSLSANKNIVIDTTAPTVSNVTSSTANGTYTTGQSISIQVVFSETVNVAGTPKLALSSGGTANYSSGTGSSTLTFTYTIGAGETSAHLDYASTVALTLNSGTITDVALNPAVLTLASPGAAGSLGSNKSFVINPFTISGQVTLSGSGLNGVTMTLSGSQSGSTTTSGSGNYTLTGLAAGGNYTVTPSLSGYTFNPASSTFNNLSANQTANFTASAAVHSPSVVSLSPVVSSGASQSYTFQFADTAGYTDLTVLNVLINNALDGRQACYIAYVQQSNTLILVDDIGDGGYAGSMPLNGSGSINNSQCTIFGAGSSSSGSGNTLTLTLNLSFSTAFGGNKVVYMAARDSVSNNTGWQTMGVHGVPPLPSTYPNPIGMNPSSGSTANPLLSFTFQDASTASNLQTGWALINTAIDGRIACYVAYYRPGNHGLFVPG